MTTYSALISTCLGIGLISKKMPGTIGSFVSIPCSFALVKISNFILNKFDSVTMIGAFALPLLLNLVLFIVGVIFAQKYTNQTKQHDAKEIVIDEVVGLNFAFLTTIPLTFLMLQAKEIHFYTDLTLILSLVGNFVLFRFFDIYKPWPINYIDKHVKGGFGIMLDDALAALFTIVVYFAVMMVGLDWM